ncbi:hypothetical protein GCM10023147_13500 [Tsukamurella soli]|uniref:SdpI/YhfL protein family protein n=1 Tax=Tsukamurella soli TaxID=644556 RepID=A0ABP8JBE0_9ACTN
MLVVLLAVAAIAALTVGVVGLAGRLRRNRWVGVRNEQTLSDEVLWRTANRVAGPALIVAGGILAVGAWSTATFGAPWGYAYFGGTLVVGMLLAGFGALQGARAASIQARIQTGQVTAGPAPAPSDPDGDPADACGVSGGCGSCALAGLCTSHAPADDLPPAR